MSTLPQIALDKLPFSAEPMSQWKNDTDIRTFAEALYPPGKASYGQEMCAEKEKPLREYARSFTKNLMEAQLSSTYRDFYQDALFGEVAKYTIALKCCIHRLLEDAGFYSLAHVLESESDIECSLLLAASFYYKQATLMLRGILEEVFLPIHYCDNISDFDAWKVNKFRTPSLRGDKGLIRRLLKKNIIHNPLASRVDESYEKLNAYVHGSESTLIHHNIHLGEKHGVEFDSDKFTIWCELLCECADISIRLLKINYDQWSVIRSSKFEALAKVGKTLCHTCHNEDGFERWLLPSKYCFKWGEVSDEGRNIEHVEDISFYQYKCLHCGQITMVNANETSLDLVVCVLTDDLPSGSSISSSHIASLVRGTEDPYCEWYAVQSVEKDIITPLLVPL